MTNLTLPCPTCNGDGFFSTGDRHAETRTDVCPTCRGRMVIPAATGEMPEASAQPVAIDTGAPTFLPVDGWRPSFAYGTEDRVMWPPEGHLLYSLFHDARLGSVSDRRQYEAIVCYFCAPKFAAPGRTAYEARYAHTTLGPRGLGGPAWDDLPAEARAVWARVEAACASRWSFDMTAAPRDGTKVDLIYPHPRGRTIDCFWGRSELHGADTWIWLTPRWNLERPCDLLPEDRWTVNCYPNMRPLAWRLADAPAVPKPEEGAHA